MTYPNTLVFIDFPSDDVDAAHAFYAEVFNWEIEERIPGLFHRIVPGQNIKVDDGFARSYRQPPYGPVETPPTCGHTPTPPRPNPRTSIPVVAPFVPGYW